jgi:uncharacterized Tic20 family protein
MKSILGYFDLNNRRYKDRVEGMDRGSAEDLYGRIFTQRIGVREPMVFNKETEQSKEEKKKWLNRVSKETLQLRIEPTIHDFTVWDQLLMYVGIFIGVLFSSAVAQFKNGNQISFKINLATIIISAVVALIIVPQAFEKLKMQSSAPLIVRFGFFVQNGVVWRVIFEAVAKAISA